MNKTALITGGAKRLGRQIALFLATKSYDLAIIYNSTSKRELQQTSKIFDGFDITYKFYKCDIRNLRELKKIIGKIGVDFKKIDLLVNNSGMITRVDFEKITPELFDDTMSVNLRAPLFVSQYALPLLKKSPKPVIINIASLGGLQNWVNHMPYSISKTAIIKLTYLLARKLAPKIRVNAIAPGTIIIDGEEKGTPQKAPVDRIPLKRYGGPKDIIEAVNFILECEYLTGQVIAVDGGRTLNN